MSNDKKSDVSAISSLGKAFSFMRPYKMQMVFATLALIFTAAISLVLVQFVRVIVDSRFCRWLQPESGAGHRRVHGSRGSAGGRHLRTVLLRFVAR